MRRSIILAVFLFCIIYPAGKVYARMPDSITGETPREYWQFLFLFESTKTPGQHEFILRLPLPFYGRYHNTERAYTFHHVLYPLFYSHGTNYWKKWTFFYFFTGSDFYHKDTKKDTDLLLSPLFAWGRGNTEKESYFSFFPFFGTWKNKLSYSEINFVLFPLYVNWSYREYKAHGILWPLIMWGGSSTRSDLRIFPFYSHKKHRGKYVRRSVLWPFIQWGYVDLDKKEPRGYLFLWPFYARKWSAAGNLNVHGILPIFIMPFVSWGSDKRTNSFTFNALWFFYQYETNDNPYIRKHIIFPFWGYYRFDIKEFLFITPFYANLKTHSLFFESNTDIFAVIIPLYWKTERYYLRDWKRETYLKIWPLFEYIKDNRGNISFRSLALWPGRSDKFERYWGPLWALVEYREFENGDRYFSTLFRIFSRYWNEREEHFFFLGLEFHSTPEYFSFEILGGLLGFRHNYALPAEAVGAPQKEENILRLFWFSI